MDKRFVFIVLMFLMSVFLSAQDSLATIKFFRRDKLAGSAISYKVYTDTIFVFSAAPGSVYTYRCASGTRKFWAQTESKNFIFVDVKAGETYYVECKLGVGAMAGTPAFRQVSSAEAIPVIRKLAPEEKLTTDVAGLSNESSATDTTRAIRNLFTRKRKAGKVRAIIFGAMGFASLVDIATYDGPAGVGPETFAVFGAIAAVSITGIVQVNKYNGDKQETLVTNFKQSRSLPDWVKKKLKRRDFN